MVPPILARESPRVRGRSIYAKGQPTRSGTSPIRLRYRGTMDAAG